LGLPQARAERQILRRLQEERRTRDRGQFATQAIDHIVGGYAGAGLPKVAMMAGTALIDGLQHHEEPALVCGRASARKADGRVHRRILQHDGHELLHLVAHGLEGNILRGLHRAHEPPRILLREKAFGHLDVEVDAQASDENGHGQRQRLVPQHPLQ